MNEKYDKIRVDEYIAFMNIRDVGISFIVAESQELRFPIFKKYNWRKYGIIIEHKKVKH